MKLNIIIFKNLVINAFTQPQFIDIEPEKAAKQLHRSLLINEDLKVEKTYENLDMYCIGQFDDETGIIINNKPVKLLSCKEVVEGVRKKRASVIEKDTSISSPSA